MLSIEWFDKFYSVLFYGTVKFSICIIITTKCNVYIKWFVVFKSYFCQVKTWQFCQAFYTILTRWMVKFEVSRAVPVCYIAILYDITLFTVEHKKIRIRKYCIQKYRHLKCVKNYMRINKSVKKNVKLYVLSFPISATCKTTRRLSTVAL